MRPSQIAERTVQIYQRVANAEIIPQPRHVRERMIGNMRERLADFVVRAKLEVHEERFSTDYRLSLLVFDPDEFWGIVQEEAMRLNRYTLPIAP